MFLPPPCSRSEACMMGVILTGPAAVEIVSDGRAVCAASGRARTASIARRMARYILSEDRGAFVSGPERRLKFTDRAPVESFDRSYPRPRFDFPAIRLAL